MNLELCLFQIVGNQYDTIAEADTSRYYETIYALLDTISPEYRLSFGEALTERLTELQKLQPQ